MSGFLSVALGAFGAHALKVSLAPNLLATFKTAVEYQMFHSLALLFVALLMMQWNKSRLLPVSGSFFIAGIIIFSGSLYALSLTGFSQLGMITPLGGLCFLVGWLALFLSALRADS